MGARLRGVALVAVVLVAGAFIGSALSQWWSAPVAGADPVVRSRPGARVRVEVLNGGGRAGMAGAATEALRDQGFDVVYYGNAGSFDRGASVVLDRVGTPEQARAVAEALGIPAVSSEPDTNLYLDVTVVLGEDWAPPAEAEHEPVPAWWDPRRFFGRGAAPLPGPVADPEPDSNETTAPTPGGGADEGV